VIVTPSRVQSGGKEGKASGHTIHDAHRDPLKGILKEGKPPHWGRMQGPSTTRLTQLHDILSFVLNSEGFCLSP
jgi:hypothetical protein